MSAEKTPPTSPRRLAKSAGRTSPPQSAPLQVEALGERLYSVNEVAGMFQVAETTVRE